MNAADLTRAAEALFTALLEPSDHLDATQVRAAVAWRTAMLTEREIAAMVAKEYGDHEDQAARRMRWCLIAVREAFATADAL